MTLDSRFSEEEQLLLSTIPSMIGSAVAFSESSGVVGTVKEMFANAKNVIEGQKSFPDNEIITGVLPNLADRKEAMEKAKQIRDGAMARLKEKGIDSQEKLRAQVVEDCATVSSLLTEKASPEEAEQFRQWAMNVAEGVAKAAKEGGFLGIGGDQVSAGEKSTLQEIASALGTTSSIA